MIFTYLTLLLFTCLVSSCFYFNQSPDKASDHSEVSASTLSLEEHQDCEEDDYWYMSMASPRPPDPSLFISEDWRNKNADEIYRALVSHPCNPRLENDTLTVKATKKRSALSYAYAEATKITLALKVYQKIGLKNYQLNYSNIRPDIRKYIFSGKKIAERELDSENIEVEIILTDYYKTISEIIANGLKKTE